MSIAAKVSSAELTAQVTSRFVNQYFEAALIYAPGTAYQPGITNDTTFKGFEISSTAGGYQRQTFNYISGNVGSYTDDGVALTQKATIFTQNGTANTISFSHVALLRGNGNVLTIGGATAKPTAAVNGTYSGLVTSTSGSGKGLKVNLTVTSSGAALGNYALTIASPGYGYAASDTVTILDANLALAGAITAGAGNLTFGASGVTTGGGQVVAVAQTASTVVLGGGNQSVFYWNLKQFGYYTV
jgi:hypothetical protein